jgi:hypothetical protein
MYTCVVSNRECFERQTAIECWQKKHNFITLFLQTFDDILHNIDVDQTF